LMLCLHLGNTWRKIWT